MAQSTENQRVKRTDGGIATDLLCIRTPPNAIGRQVFHLGGIQGDTDNDVTAHVQRPEPSRQRNATERPS